MATSSRQSAIFGTNDWKAIYQTFRQADFQSYDYETLRKSFIDYLRLYYPETFNDYTESSEFVALLDVMAFMGQAMAFRGDLNTRENFIDTAERRDSVIKLANLISYTPKRNTTGQGYIKVTAVSTTENVNDINGLNLANIPIIWNDPANAYWQEQFNSIINATLVDSQRVGKPGNSQTILGVKTDEYSVSIPSTSLPVVPFTTVVDGNSMDFEAVSVTSVNEDYVYELPPSPRGIFNMLYRNDKLGYGSPNTGFFLYFKQGRLQTNDFTFQQQISNNVHDINIQGINNSDTWLYEVDATTGARTQWKQVENVYANANLQTNTSDRKIFSVVSRFNDQVTYIFGDGVFSEIPVGNYRAYVRSGNALQYTIDPIEMQSINVNLSYVSRYGRVETLTLTLELQLPVTTAQTRETLAQIKERAPARYYTQNRMVNGEDYNNFPFTLYNSIIKSKAINRTSVGVARNFDLLDPTGKYSSTNSFSDDGALYQEGTDGSTILQITSTNDIVQFLTEKLLAILTSHRVQQYYVQNYNRYDVNSQTGDGTVYWKQLSKTGNTCTGYFYTLNGSTIVPVPIGSYSSYDMKYATAGALVKVEAPAGQYFDENNRLVTGMVNPTNKTFYWANILDVYGDGYNNGQGGFSDNTGPVTINGFLNTGVIVTQVIPSFDNQLPNSVVQDCIRRMELNQNFCLVFDNSLLATQDRWSVQSYPNSNYFVNFVSLGNDRYSITFKSLAYYFGSVADTRFAFDQGKLVYDPKSGQILQDYVSVLKSNTLPDSTYSIGRNTILNIVGNTVEADGYPDDFSIEIANTDPNNSQLILDPDFFQYVTGYETGGPTTGKYVFFQQMVDAYLLSRFVIVPSSDVVYSYGSKSQIEAVKYEYNPGQLFYAYTENKFYTTEEDNTSENIVNVIDATGYSVKVGRQGLGFQYRHNSNNTTRINPSTTNIIDLYVVTQAYYTQYMNWLVDTSGTLTEPSIPSISELSTAYTNLNDYKMLTDSIVLNSVHFKPLFGSKAAPALQATIKVIKASNTTASDSEIRSAVLNSMNNYFSINNWNFGDTFYFSELGAYLHKNLGDYLSSVVLVPNDPNLAFGALYEVRCAPYEIFVNGAKATDIVVISALTPAELQS